MVFVNKIVGGAVPKEFVGPTEKGIREAAATGILGYPMVDLEIDLVDGSYHDVDSSERSFFIAGSMGFKEAANGPGRCCWSPSWTWKWWRRRTSWAKSWAN